MKVFYMLDTDTCSYIIKGTNEKLKQQVKRHKARLCISSITLGELLFGAAKKGSSRLDDAVDLFRQLVEIRMWTDEASEQYANIRKDLEASGSAIGNMDMLIAASAKAEKCHLVTNNTKHFSRITGLQLENWL